MISVIIFTKDYHEYLFQVWQYYLLPPEEQRMPGVKNPMCSAFPRVGESNIKIKAEAEVSCQTKCFLLISR